MAVDSGGDPLLPDLLLQKSAGWKLYFSCSIQHSSDFLGRFLDQESPLLPLEEEGVATGHGAAHPSDLRGSDQQGVTGEEVKEQEGAYHGELWWQPAS